MSATFKAICSTQHHQHLPKGDFAIMRDVFNRQCLLMGQTSFQVSTAQSSSRSSCCRWNRLDHGTVQQRLRGQAASCKRLIHLSNKEPGIAGQISQATSVRKLFCIILTARQPWVPFTGSQSTHCSAWGDSLSNKRQNVSNTRLCSQQVCSLPSQCSTLMPNHPGHTGCEVWK